MRGVRPLTVEEEKAMVKGFRGRWAVRNRCLFATSCSTGFRIGELLSLRFKDVLTSKGRIVSTIQVAGRKMKESRGRSWKVSPRLRKELKRYIDELGKRGIPHQPKRPLFPTDSAVAALDSRSAWESWRRAADVAGLEGRIGTHSGRKTFAWRVYDEAARQMREGKSELDPMRAVQLALGHKSIETTISYMGFLDKDLDKVINALFSRGEL